MSKDDLSALALAVVISGGLLVAMAKQLPGDSVRLESPEASLASSQWAVEVTSLDSHAPEATESPAATLEELRAACVREARQVNLVVADRTACARFEQAANREAANQPRPHVSHASYEPDPAVANPSRQVREPRRETPEADVCIIHAYGSIAYRDCRASHKKALLARCKRATDSAEATSGPYRAQMKELARDKCRVAELYQIVN